MKKSNAFIPVLFIASLLIYACDKNADPNRAYFTIPAEDRKINIPVQLNDSVTATMTFDFCGGGWMFILDSSFVAAHPEVASAGFLDTRLSGSAWSTEKYLEFSNKVSHTVKIGNTDVKYDVMRMTNWKKAMRNDKTDGLFCIPENDTTHVWELNFEHNYMEIHPADNFQLPENCLLCPLVYPRCIQIPMHITCAGGDTLTTNHIYSVDTGLALDVVLVRTNELDFFNRQEGAVWTGHYNWYNRHYTVSATLFDGFVADSLRIYTYDKSNLPDGASLVGTNFLKRFNVFFDIKNRQIGLQPLKNFKRIVNPLGRRFHYSIEPDANHKFIITFMADYQQNYYKNAGLMAGDEVIAINGIAYKDITNEQESEYYKQDALFFDIIRNGEPMQITVPVDKTEVQGD